MPLIDRAICWALLFCSGSFLLALWVIAFIVDAVVGATYKVVDTVRGKAAQRPRIVVMVRGVRDWPWSCAKYLYEANLGLPHNVRYHYLDQKKN
jgi:hypothetical protein